MQIEGNTLYLMDAPKGMRQLSKGSIDLVIADLVNDPAQRASSNRKRHRAARFDPTPYLEESQRILKLFNGFFFTQKAQLPAYIAFAQKNGFAWDLLVWEHSHTRHDMVPNCDFIVTIWERGAYFNVDYKRQFFQKVKHHAPLPASKRGSYQGDKPYKLIEELVQQRTRPGDIVLDPLAGTGVVPLVCTNTDRHFIAFESNPKLYDLARKALEVPSLEATGDEAVQLQMELPQTPKRKRDLNQERVLVEQEVSPSEHIEA